MALSISIVEVLENIMRYMTPASLSRAMLVNRLWSKVARTIRNYHHIWTYSHHLPLENQLLLQSFILQRKIHRLRLNLDSSLYSNHPISIQLLCNGKHPAFLTELILHIQSIPPSLFYPLFAAHATTLQALEIKVSDYCELDLIQTLDTLPNLRSLVLSHIHWNATFPRPGIKFTGYTLENTNGWYQNAYVPTDSTIDWINDPKRQYPNLQSLELRSVTARQFIPELLKKSPNLKSIRLMQVQAEVLSVWMKSIKQFNPHVREIGASGTGVTVTHEYMSWILHSYQHVEVIEWPTAQFVPATFTRFPRLCPFLKELDLSEVTFTDATNSALFTMLCEPMPYLRRLVAPLATINIQYALDNEKSGAFWQCRRLETLFVGFECSLTQGDNTAGLNEHCSSVGAKDSHNCEFSGALFRYLAKYCPRLMYLRSSIKPQICLGPTGLKQLMGLQELEEIDLYVNRLDTVKESDIQWLQHESVHAFDERYGDAEGAGYYWPRLETIRITAKHHSISQEWSQWIDNLSLRFAFILQDLVEL
ncbi:hypothetical protein BGX27_009755 [Mortierella sp. AM989]|nr:hypothetical protein BGX27_009755 [Mortierella sp. AM989]